MSNLFVAYHFTNRKGSGIGHAVLDVLGPPKEWDDLQAIQQRITNIKPEETDKISIINWKVMGDG